MSGVLGKAGFRIEGGSVSGTGLASSTYPINATQADAEEVALQSYDRISLASESLKRVKMHEQDETILGDSGTPGIDVVEDSVLGSLNVKGSYDGMTQLIAAAMGFEYPGTSGASMNPDYTKGTSEVNGTVQSSTNNTITATSQIFGSSNVGGYVYMKPNVAASSQVRRITAVNTPTNDTITVTPNWTVNPSATNTFVVAKEFYHVFELAPQLQDQKWTDVFASYPTTGVFTANDKCIRRGTLGIKRYDTDIIRSAMVNAMKLSCASGNSLEATFDLACFDEDNDSATNANLDSLSFHPSRDYTNMISFNHCEVYIKDYSTSSGFTSSHLIGVTGFNVSLNNSLVMNDPTFNASPYMEQPTRGGKREVTGTFSLPRYNSDSLKTQYGSDTIMMAKIVFTGSTIDTISESFTIWLPSFKFIDFNANITGSGNMEQKLDFQALIPDGLASGFPTQYITTPRSEMMISMVNRYPFNPFLDQNREY